MEAMHYTKHAKNLVKCHLCPHGCVIAPHNTGICRVRKNNSGSLYAINYGMCTALALDPIEKKPLWDFWPGSLILSLGTFGCNLECSFCQNWQIAHGPDPRTEEVPPKKAALLADKYKDRGNIGIAYTYSEPLMWYEYVLDTAKEVRTLGLKNILVSNGYINEEPLKELLPFIDGANIDVKGFNQTFYPKLCRGSLEPVKRTVELLAQDEVHVEVTTLVIPGENDTLDEIRELAQWIAGISPKIPLHLSRYFPNYKLNLPPTPRDTLMTAQEIASRYLEKVYLGNL